MFAIDHAATALLIKRRFPSVPIAPLLVSVRQVSPRRDLRQVADSGRRYAISNDLCP